MDTYELNLYILLEIEDKDLSSLCRDCVSRFSCPALSSHCSDCKYYVEER